MRKKTMREILLIFLANTESSGSNQLDYKMPVINRYFTPRLFIILTRETDIHTYMQGCKLQRTLLGILD